MWGCSENMSLYSLRRNVEGVSLEGLKADLGDVDIGGWGWCVAGEGEDQ
jgi:hypothetical protein